MRSIRCDDRDLPRAKFFICSMRRAPVSRSLKSVHRPAVSLRTFYRWRQRFGGLNAAGGDADGGSGGRESSFARYSSAISLSSLRGPTANTTPNEAPATFRNARQSARSTACRRDSGGKMRRRVDRPLCLGAGQSLNPDRAQRRRSDLACLLESDRCSSSMFRVGLGKLLSGSHNVKNDIDRETADARRSGHWSCKSIYQKRSRPLAIVASVTS